MAASAGRLPGALDALTRTRAGRREPHLHSASVPNRRLRAPADAAAPGGMYREVRRRRDIVDAVRLVRFAALAVVGLGLATVADRTASGFEADLVDALGVIPATVAVFVLGALQVLYVVLLVVTPTILVVTRRFGALGRGALAIVAAPLALSAVESALGTDPRGARLDGSSTFGGSDWPPTGALASVAAVATVLGPGIPRRWHRAIWGFLWVIALIRVLTATTAPLDLVLAVGIGGVVGALLLLALGRAGRVLTPEGVAALLNEAGLPVTDLRPNGRSPWDYRAQAEDHPVWVSRSTSTTGTGAASTAPTDAFGSAASATTPPSPHPRGRSAPRRWSPSTRDRATCGCRWSAPSPEPLAAR